MSNENSGSATVGQIIRASIGPFLIFAIAIYFYCVACAIGQCPPGQLGAEFWPKMILIFLMISCVIKFGEIIWNRHHLAKEAQARPEMDNVKLSLMIVLLIATVFAIDYVGFALANFLFMIAFLSLVGFRKIGSVLLVSVLGTIGMLYVFVKVVYLPLPKGMGVFETVSLFIYRALFIL